MYGNKTIAVVVPAFNEEKLIAGTINSVPSFVDSIIVVDDASFDGTSKAVRCLIGRKVLLIRHEVNQGVGSAIISGYKRAQKLNMDIVVVMAGDAQMDPLDLPSLLDPIVQGKADYVKGNRLGNPNIFKIMPKIRLFGNTILSLLTKMVSGYWQLNDSQCGYTAVTKEVLRQLDLDKLYKKYGFPNDMLVKLNVLNAKVKDVAVKAIYNTERSKLNILSFAPKIIFLSIKWYFWRIFYKYILPVQSFYSIV